MKRRAILRLAGASRRHFAHYIFLVSSGSSLKIQDAAHIANRTSGSD